MALLAGIFCFWTVASGSHALVAQAMVSSARRVGVDADFHIWSDRPITGAHTHAAGAIEGRDCLYKLTHLRDAAAQLPYPYLVFLDADCWFVRHPGDPLRLLRGSPVHLTLEDDLSAPALRNSAWWNTPCPRLLEMMHAAGVRHRSVRTANGGFFIVKRSSVAQLFDLAFEFWEFAKTHGHSLGDEPLLTFAMHRMCADPRLHTLETSAHFWASDWKGHFADRFPDGSPWPFSNHFTGKETSINPAIVHAMKSKQAMIQSLEPPPVQRIGY